VEPNSHLVYAFGLPHGMEWMWIAVVMLLLFGSRLPSVMRNLGGSVKEFKKGMEDSNAPPPAAPAQRIEGAVPRDPHGPASANISDVKNPPPDNKPS
jgi:TatA/E family protein of Tat protein translocase